MSQGVMAVNAYFVGRLQYNYIRPHSSLDNLTPRAYRQKVENEPEKFAGNLTLSLVRF
jgi:hypothetical protein